MSLNTNREMKIIKKATHSFDQWVAKNINSDCLFFTRCMCVYISNKFHFRQSLWYYHQSREREIWARGGGECEEIGRRRCVSFVMRNMFIPCVCLCMIAICMRCVLRRRTDISCSCCFSFINRISLWSCHGLDCSWIIFHLLRLFFLCLFYDLSWLVQQSRNK